MKYQILFLEKIRKMLSGLSSSESAHSVVCVKSQLQHIKF